MRLRHIAAALLALASSVLPAAAQTADERQKIDWALERGRLLFALDRAAWVATDDMFAKIPDPTAAGIIGYIVDRDAEGFTTIFFGREGDRRVAVYRARISGGGVANPQVFAAGSRPALTETQTRMARALEAVRGVRVQTCSNAAPNVAIIPPTSADAPVEVYINDPQMQRGSWQFGGHHRLAFDAEGHEVARRSFTNACLLLPAPPAAARQQGAMLGVSHLLDPVPNEIHVFIAMAAQQPIGVITGNPNRLWSVTGEGIRLLQAGGNVLAP